ncbi:MAG: hypothetical protein ACM36C_08435, partial [Acidobacteriota bacterium]
MESVPGAMRYDSLVEHAPAVGLILALALGLVSLALIARLPQRDAVPGLAWLPVTLLLYNLWVAGFLAAASFSPPMHRPTPPADGWTLTLLALAVAWVFAHVVQLEAFLGRAPSPIVRRAGLYTIAGVVILLLAARLLGALVKNDTIIGYCLAVL